MFFTFKKCFVAIISVGLCGLTADTVSAGEEPIRTMATELVLTREPVTGPIAIRLPTSTQWQGQQYDIETGIDVFMGVIRDPKESTRNRNAALLDLSRLRTHLKGRPCLGELRTRFADAGKFEKKSILSCFHASHDPDAIPLLIHVLDSEDGSDLRLSAAKGLANWNVRRGVAELIRLFDSTDVVQSLVPTTIISHNARGFFRYANESKGWGFPSNDWWTAIDSRNDLDEDQRKVLRNVAIEKEINAIKEWFSENEHRFPDWKPGDPLPKVETPDKSHQ